MGAGCRGCADLDDRIEQALAAYPYTGWVADAVQRIKYRGEWSRAEQFAPALADLVQSLGPIDGLVPVPLHTHRLDLRGFNQAEELAWRIAPVVGVPIAPILERIKDTPTQVKQDKPARIANMDGAFGISSDARVVANGRYVLIDDVRTSGATVNACARAIAEHAASTSIFVVTVALDIPQPQLATWLTPGS